MFLRVCACVYIGGRLRASERVWPVGIHTGAAVNGISTVGFEQRAVSTAAQFGGPQSRESAHFTLFGVRAASALRIRTGTLFLSYLPLPHAYTTVPVLPLCVCVCQCVSACVSTCVSVCMPVVSVCACPTVHAGVCRCPQIRISGAPKAPDGSTLSRKRIPKAEWLSVGLDDPSPFYCDAVYDSSRCHIHPSEEGLFLRKAAIAQMGFTTRQFVTRYMSQVRARLLLIRLCMRVCLCERE